MTKNKVVSLFEVKQKKLKIDEEKLYNDMRFDWYISYKEITFWKSLSDFGISYSKSMFETTENKLYQQFQEVFELLSIDLDMYRDFGKTLEKFRFLFSYFEVYTFYKVMILFKNSTENYKNEVQYYTEKLERAVNQDTLLCEKLNRLLKENGQ